MEENFFDLIKNELEHEVEGKEKWLNDLITKSSHFSQELQNLSSHLNSKSQSGLFVSISSASDLLSHISSIFPLPSYISLFSSALAGLVDEQLSFKYLELSVLVSKWTNRLSTCLKLYEIRSHCKYLYEKILNESGKMTQDHRVKEMELIKEDYWTSYLLKHKEFQLSLNELQDSAKAHFVSPVVQHVRFCTGFLSTYAENLKQVEESVGKGESLMRIQDFNARFEYNQRSLKVLEKEKIFGYVRAKMFEGNSGVVKDFEPTGPGELKVEKGDRFMVRSGDFHCNWVKGIGGDGNKGFVPKVCVEVFRFGLVLQEPDRVYKISFGNIDFKCEIEKHLETLSGFIKSYTKLNKSVQREQHLIRLMSRIGEIIRANKILLHNYQEFDEIIHDYFVFLPNYTESYHFCLKVLQSSSEKLVLSPLICAIAEEIKSFIQLLRKLLYTKYSQDQSALLYELIEIISLACWQMTKTLKTSPNEQEILSMLEDPKQKQLKRLNFQLNSLILFENFIIFSQIPLKISKILPVEEILDVCTDEERILIKTSKKNFYFQTDNNKRAVDWVAEIETLIQKTEKICWVCKEVNIVKVVSQCFKCGKMICWVCECSHN